MRLRTIVFLAMLAISVIPATVGAAPHRPTFRYVLPTTEWVRDATTNPNDHWAQLTLKHQTTKAVVLIRAELAGGKDAAFIAKSEMVRRAATGSDVGEYAQAPDGRWASFSFVFDRVMLGHCMVFRDREHPEWIITVIGSWDMTKDTDGVMDLELDGIAAYLHVIP